MVAKSRGRRILWSLFVLADAMLVWSFVAGYLAWYVPPRVVWWLELFAIVLPYTSLALVLVFGVVLALRRKRMIVLHAVLLALILARFVPFRMAGYFREEREEDLTVLTYNVPYGDLLGSGPGARRAALRRLLAKEGVDLASLQEASIYLRDGKLGEEAKLPEVAPSPEYAYARPAPVADVVAVHQPLLGRVEMGTQELIPLRYSVPAGEASTVVRTPFVWQGRAAVHYNVHLQSYALPPHVPANTSDLTPRSWLHRLVNSKFAFRARAEEAEQIRRMLDRERVPVVLSGDFNSTPHNWSYRHIAAGMADAYKAAGVGWGATYHRRFPAARIDFILVGPEWEVVSAWIPEADLSDHNPVVARVRWKE